MLKEDKEDSMNFEDYREKLTQGIYDGCLNCIEYIANEANHERVYAFVLYCTSGCTSVGISYSTRESLERKLSTCQNESEIYMTVYSPEWEYVNINYEAFQSTDDIIDELYEDFYDLDLDETEIDNLFVDIFTEVITRIKNERQFRDKCFEDDLLLGLQFPDPSLKGIEMATKVSENVNSEKWHKLLTESFKEIKKFA